MTELLVVWSDINKTGITIIDEQHRGSVCIMNSMFWLMREGQGTNAVVPIIRMMLGYAQIHFMTEEHLLQKAEWPHFAEHAKLHRIFLERLNALAMDFKNTGEYDDILQHFKEWWTEHINDQDKQYINHLKQRFPQYCD